jgi:crossover junction endodeoxyribonuclease RusA
VSADVVRLTLPLPPAGCSPNARGHWSKRARAVAEYRARSAGEARKILARHRQRWERAVASAVFYLPDARRRDHDNLAASLKAAFDGLKDADVLADDYGLRHEPIRVEIDRTNPRVEITVEPLPRAA